MSERRPPPLEGLLKPGARSQVYRLAGRTSAKTLARVAEAAGWRFLLVDGSSVRDKTSFLEAAAEGLRFPEWAGRNWDAFEELVNDLSWLPEGPGIVVLFDRLSRFAAAEPEQVRLVVEILQTATGNRQAGDAALIVLLRGAGPAANRLMTME